MGESDVIIRKKTLAKKNVSVNIMTFYRNLKKYLKEEHGYTKFNEKCHNEDYKEGLKNLKIKVDVIKKIDDYTEFKLKITIKMNNYKVAIVKGKKLQKGDFGFEVDALLENDYKNKWEDNVFRKFSRGMYDKLILRDHFNKLGKEVEDECLETVGEIKRILGMEK